MSSNSTEHEAVFRLYELARNGEVENTEFSQLDSMVYERFMRSYDIDTIQTQTESIS
ncbi:MAG: hypothetical protein ACR2J7_02305 [Luteimonas sp.]